MCVMTAVTGSLLNVALGHKAGIFWIIMNEDGKWALCVPYCMLVDIS